MAEYEPGVSALIRKYARGVCLDIGANAGWLTDIMSETADEVHAFEPHPTNVRKLCKMLPKNVTVHVVAVCDRDGEVAFFDCKDTAGGHALWNPAKAANNVKTRARPKQRIVQACRLDTLHLSPQFIKIDVEGAEYAVLKGAVQTIEKHRPVVVLEINAFGLNALGSHEDDVRQFFRDRSYTEYGVLDEEPWIRALQPGETMQLAVQGDDGTLLPVFNMLFLP